MFVFYILFVSMSFVSTSSSRDSPAVELAVEQDLISVYVHTRRGQVELIFFLHHILMGVFSFVFLNVELSLFSSE